MSHKLQNYLRTFRKRSGLSQDEVAFLLGCRSGAKICRYESFARRPNLENALAYKLVFGADARELFGGLFQNIQRETSRRAQLLIQKLTMRKPDRVTARKLVTLRSVASGTTNEPQSNKTEEGPGH